MHPDQFPVTGELAKGLLAGQFPNWSSLPLVPLQTMGTDHALFRLGKEMLLRLPLTRAASAQREKEHVWLPRLAPQLPLKIPRPLALGRPGPNFPFPWSVYSWLPGRTLCPGAKTPVHLALQLAEFILCLRNLDTEGGPPAGPDNFGRGLPLITRDEMVLRSLGEMRGMLDEARVLEHWHICLAAEAWKGPPVWVHGDLREDNLLARDGKISAVIDFGGLGLGDPAVDMLIAWSLFDPPARKLFREAAEVDEAAWLRGQGWAISVAVTAIPYYLKTNPAMVAYGRRLLTSVMEEA